MLCQKVNIYFILAVYLMVYICVFLAFEGSSESDQCAPKQERSDASRTGSPQQTVHGTAEDSVLWKADTNYPWAACTRHHICKLFFIL